MRIVRRVALTWRVLMHGGEEPATTALIPRRVEALATGTLELIGGPHCGGYFHCSLEDVELGQYYPLPDHPPMPIPPVYAGTAFYVVEQRDDGQLIAMYARPEFNPYAADRGESQADAPMLKI